MKLIFSYEHWRFKCHQDCEMTVERSTKLKEVQKRSKKQTTYKINLDFGQIIAHCSSMINSDSRS